MTGPRQRIEACTSPPPIIGYRTCQVCQKDYPIYRGQGNSKHCLGCANTVKRQQNKECAARIREHLGRIDATDQNEVVGRMSFQHMSPERMTKVFKLWSKGEVDFV